jgi:hypothetical protein
VTQSATRTVEHEHRGGLVRCLPLGPLASRIRPHAAEDKLGACVSCVAWALFLPLIGPQRGGRDGNNRMLYDVGLVEDAPDDSQREIGNQERGNRDGEHHLKAARPANLVGAAEPQSGGLLAVALTRPRRGVCMNG